MSAQCPRCGERYFICGFCNSELESVEAVLLEDRYCRTHYCSIDCLNEEVGLLEAKNLVGTNLDSQFPCLIELKQSIAS